MADRIPSRDAGVAAKAWLAEIYTSKRFSDHATLIIDYSARLRPVARESENGQSLRQLSPGQWRPAPSPPPNGVISTLHWLPEQ
jgi:hypothetical protein